MNDPTADLALAYRLLCAANLAYGVTRDAEATSTLEILPPILPDVATLDVLRDRVGFLPGSIHLHQAMARDGIDAYLYGEIKDASILAFRGTLPMRLTGRLPQILGDWFNNTRALLVDGQRLGLPGCVHQGYAESLDLLWQAPDGITGILGWIADATAFACSATFAHIWTPPFCKLFRFDVSRSIHAVAPIYSAFGEIFADLWP